MTSEPASAAAVADWIAQWRREVDPFERVRLDSEEHRRSHGPGCTVYPTASGPLIGVLVRAAGARRVLEVGCGLGYSALWLAHGSGGVVDTIEHDDDHARLAEAQFVEHGHGRRIRVLRGRASEVLPALEPTYDLVFSDSDPVEMPDVLDHALRLLRAGGLLVSANLFLAQFVGDLPHLDRMVEYRTRLVRERRLMTAFAPGGLAVSVKTG